MVGGAQAASLTQAPHAPSTARSLSSGRPLRAGPVGAVPLPRSVSLRGGGQANAFPRCIRIRALPTTTPKKKDEQQTHDPEKWRPVFGPRSCAKKREAERREAHPTMAAPFSSCPPLVGDGWEGVGSGLAKPARLSALHCGACRNERTLQLSPGRASREQEDAGVIRAVIRA